MLHRDPRNGGGNRLLYLSKWLFVCFCFSFMSFWKACDLRENRKWWLKSETEWKKGGNKLMKSEEIKIILIKIPHSVAGNFCGTHDIWWEMQEWMLIFWTSFWYLQEMYFQYRLIDFNAKNCKIEGKNDHLMREFKQKS